MACLGRAAGQDERKWTHRGLNPGPSACKADALPLRYAPTLDDRTPTPFSPLRLTQTPRHATQTQNTHTSQHIPDTRAHAQHDRNRIHNNLLHTHSTLATCVHPPILSHYNATRPSIIQHIHRRYRHQRASKTYHSVDG